MLLYHKAMLSLSQALKCAEIPNSEPEPKWNRVAGNSTAVKLAGGGGETIIVKYLKSIPNRKLNIFMYIWTKF